MILGMFFGGLLGVCGNYPTHEDDINIDQIIGRMVGQTPATKREFFNARHEVVDEQMRALC
ncbi:MAG: hypothetical protein ACT6FG_07870 [Methanosarcinaceae archaeon]